MIILYALVSTSTESNVSMYKVGNSDQHIESDNCYK